MFENPVMLAGVGGAVVPLVIHLLARARYRTVDWGAMMFIAPASVKLTEGVRVREIALLLVRMAAVALLAVALARPIANARSSAAPVESRVAAAIVVDCSASMAYEELGGSRMDRARETVLQILSTFRRGDRVAIIPADARQAPTPQLTGDLQSLAARANELKPTAGSADLPRAIELASAMLDQQDRAEKKLYVVCDRQAVNWRDTAAAQKWTASPFLIAVGGSEAGNVAVEQVELLNPPAIAGCASEVLVRVRNLGPSRADGLPLTIRLGGKEVQSTTLSIPAGQTETVAALVTFPTAGQSVLSVDLKSQGAALDDHRDFVVDVTPPLRVLLLRDNVNSTDAFALRAALAPYSMLGRAGPDAASVTTVAVDQWDPVDLAKYQVVILDNVTAPTAPQAGALAQFVYSGGGLLLAPGPASQTSEYNRLFYREEAGLLPALLQPAINPMAAVAIEHGTIDTAQPMLRFLAGRTGSIAMQVERFIPTTGRTPAAHALASFTSGDAFLLEQTYGRGRVLLVTSSLGSAWTTLPMTNLYLPLVQSATRYLAASSIEDRNISAGQELTAFFDPPVTGSRGTVIRPDGTRDACDVATIDNRSEARYGRTDLPGLYTIRAGARGQERSATFSVAPPTSESDLTPLSDAQWKDLATRYGFTRVEPGDAALAGRSNDDRAEQGEFWIWALAGVVTLLVAELALSSRLEAQAA